MRLLSKFVLIFSLCLFSTVTYAQEHERYRLPEGIRLNTGGLTYQCFDLEEYRILLGMDVDLRFLEQAYANALSRLERQEQVIQQLVLALDASNRQIDALQLERQRLIDRWTEENRLRLEAENRPMFGDWVGWGLAAAEAVVIVTMLLLGIP